jgi:two-component system, response regulator
MMCTSMPILLAEDNPDHAELTKKALKRANLANEIFHVKDGEEALQFLFHEGPYAGRANGVKPALIVLDLRMPKIDGLGVLRRIKQDPELRSIPTVMLTTIEEKEEMSEAYALGANSYVTKPVQFTEFVEKVKLVGLYWLLTNARPKD